MRDLVFWAYCTIEPLTLLRYQSPENDSHLWVFYLNNVTVQKASHSVGNRFVHIIPLNQNRVDGSNRTHVIRTSFSSNLGKTLKLRNNLWKPVVLQIFKTYFPLCHGKSCQWVHQQQKHSYHHHETLLQWQWLDLRHEFSLERFDQCRDNNYRLGQSFRPKSFSINSRSSYPLPQVRLHSHPKMNHGNHSQKHRFTNPASSKNPNPLPDAKGNTSINWLDTHRRNHELTFFQVLGGSEWNLTIPCYNGPLPSIGRPFHQSSTQQRTSEGTVLEFLREITLQPGWIECTLSRAIKSTEFSLPTTSASISRLCLSETMVQTWPIVTSGPSDSSINPVAFRWFRSYRRHAFHEYHFQKENLR